MSAAIVSNRVTAGPIRNGGCGCDPALIIGGGRDVSDIHRIVGKLATEIPDAGSATLPDAGHLVPMEKPNEFNRLVEDFLRSLPSE